MKVLQILPELNAGGVERVVGLTSQHLVAQGHESVVVSNGGRMVGPLEQDGARHITLPVHRKSPLTLFQVGALRRVLEEERPDILHYHSRVPGWVALLAWRKMNPANRPRLISTMHGFYSVNAYSAIMARGERVIAVSECIRDYIHNNYPQTPRTNIRLVRHGIEPADYHPGFVPPPDWLARWKKEFPQLVGKQLLLLPGRITRLKGHEDFLQLLAALRRDCPLSHGVIVGDAHPRKRAYLAELQQRVAQLGLTTNVTFVGHRNDLREIMAISHLVYSLSTSPESFGLTTLEALALGRPVIGYDHGGVGELLRELFPVGRVPLRDNATLLSKTRGLLAQAQTPARVGAPFTLEAMCRETLATYIDALSQNPPQK